MNSTTTYQLIIVKTAMTSSDYVKINQILKQIQGEKHTPNIYKVPTTKSEVIIKYLEQEKLNYEIYSKEEKLIDKKEYIIDKKTNASKQKNVKGQILELKKTKLLETLQVLYKKKGISNSIINPNSKYESIYLTYLRWRKKYPKELPSFKKLLTE